MIFFNDGLPTPLTAIPVHTTLLHCMKGRCSIAISPGFLFYVKIQLLITSLYIYCKLYETLK